MHFFEKNVEPNL